jgi:hypothetical protein
MPRHPHEEATILAFIKREKRDRYLTLLANAERRSKFLTCLNHCDDFDARFVEELASASNVSAVLIGHGSPPECHLISDVKSLDGRLMPLAEAVESVEFAGFGSILCCIPGKLACHIGEAGTGRRLLLRRPS